MTPSELKRRHETAFPESKFFCRENMRGAGDTMRNYGCRMTTLNITEAWELYRRYPAKYGGHSSAYFDRATFKRVHA